MTRVRCHAAVMAQSIMSAAEAHTVVDSDIPVKKRSVRALGEVCIYPGVIVCYDSEVLPSENDAKTAVTPVGRCEVIPFSCETASTVDFNGIALLSAGAITFIPMQCADSYLR